MSGRGPGILAVLVIVATGLVCAWPLVGSGGWQTYQDNPCHLAELHDLVRGEGGWSDAAFLGFPVTRTHSPLWYGLLGRLVGAGLPAGLVLTLFGLAGFLAPALAVLAVTRRHAPLWAATLAGWLVLVQRPWLEGFESPLGGMAPFGLAAACLVLIVGELVRPRLDRRGLARLGALYGLLGLTHLFLIWPAVIAFLLAAISQRRWTDLPARLGAAALGALAAASYWLPAFLDRAHLVIHDQPLAPHLGLLYLLLPLHPLELAQGILSWQTELAFTDAIPMIGLVALGLLGLRRAWHDPAARLGLLLAGVLLVLVLLVVPWTGTALLGPHSWRRLFLVRLGLALAAAPVLASLAPLAAAGRGRRPVATVAVLLVLSGLWWQRPLALATPPGDSPEIVQLGDAWRWLRDHRPPQRGRLFVQDTFYLRGESTDLYHSHLPALTARETGWEQVGAFYGGMPYPTEEWTSGQFGLVLGSPLLDTADLLRVGDHLPRAGVTRLLLANPVLARKLADTGFYRQVFRRGRFTVLDPHDTTPNWAESPDARSLVVRRPHPGRIELEADLAREPATITVSEAHATSWTVSGPDGVAVRPHQDGRLELTGVPRGTAALTLRHRPERWPWLLSSLGWLGLLSLAVLPGRPPRNV